MDGNLPVPYRREKENGRKQDLAEPVEAVSGFTGDGQMLTMAQWSQRSSKKPPTMEELEEMVSMLIWFWYWLPDPFKLKYIQEDRNFLREFKTGVNDHYSFSLIYEPWGKFTEDKVFLLNAAAEPRKVAVWCCGM